MNIRLTTRLYNNDDLSQGVAVAVSPEQAHYLQNVMRLKVGDIVRLFNERGGEWHCVIDTVSKRSLYLVARERLRLPAPEPDVWLCCAPIKKAHFDYMIEKATELGVAVIQPILTARTQIREVNVERARSIAIEAAEQSERLSIPDMRAPKTLKDLLAAWPEERTLFACAELGAAVPVHQALTSAPSSPQAAIITGPEGGFTPEELQQLRQAPNAIPVRLGPRILRADTAALAALSLWQGVCGDWTTHQTPDR